jgi:uncharacterized protein (DUF58 family)
MSGRPSTRICAEGWYYLFVVLFVIGGAVLGEVNLLVVLAGLMAGPFLFNWQFVRWTLRDVEVERALPSRLCAGDPLTVVVTAHNRRDRLASWALTVEDGIVQVGVRSRPHRQRLRLTIPRVAPRQTARSEVRIQLTRRGRYEFGPLRVSTRFPLGFVRASYGTATRSTLLVGPRLGHLTQRWLHMVHFGQTGSPSERRRQGLLEGDYYGLREWRTGDSRRWIHWRTSAKLGELAVRQFERQVHRDLILVLDLWEPDAPSRTERTHTEVAISFLGTAVADISRRGGGHVVVVVAGRGVRCWSAPTSPMLAQEVLDHLADITPGDGLAIYRALEEGRQLSPAAPQTIVISTRGAPFLTAGNEGGADTPLARPQRAFGNLIWIDCRSDVMSHFFHPHRQ